MAIPINPNFIANAARAVAPRTGNPISLYDCLVQDESFVPMQFTFNKNLTWKVDLSIGYPKRPLQKISSLYIDALNSGNDAILYFPNTGWGIRIAAGTQFLVNDLTDRGDYVFLVNLQASSTNPIDIINIFALNINVPFFDTLWQYPQGKNNSTGNNSSTWFYTDPDQPGPPPDLPTVSAKNIGLNIDQAPVLISTSGGFSNTLAAWAGNFGSAATFSFTGPNNQPVTGTLIGITLGSCLTVQGPFSHPVNEGPFTDTHPVFKPSNNPIPSANIVTNATLSNVLAFYNGANCVVPR